MTTVTVTVRYFAAARAAAGVETETVQVPAGATVDDPAQDASAPRTATSWPACSTGAASCSTRSRCATGDLPLHDGALVDVLPPFAGG